MQTTVRMIIMSHLSDVQEINLLSTPEKLVNTHINFAKYLLCKYNDINVKVDAENEFDLFCTANPNLV